MADKRIKGITVEIGGDTTGLDKALQGVNRNIRDTQSQLKDVEKLLKLDPGNTELLAQKHKLLAQAVGETKEKLDTLKTAQEQAKQQLEAGTLGQEKYDALQREIIETEEELGKLQDAAKESGAALGVIADAGEKLQAAGDKISGVGSKLMPVTAAVAGLGAAAVKTVSEFDSSMSQVAAVSGATGADFDALRAKAREMGAETKFSAAEAADAMNYMAMAGWKTEDMLNGIEGIMNLAAASGEDLASVSDIVTDALTAFGLSAEDSGHFADLLAAASSNANTNVSMLGESFKYAAPVMGAMGYSAEDAALALGLMANSGVKASQAGTTLRNLLSRMAHPTADVADAMEALGLSLDDGEGNMLSFRALMEDMRKGFGGLKISQEDLTAGVSELDAALADGTMTEVDYNIALHDLMERAYGAEGAMKAEAAAMLAGKGNMAGLLAIVNASQEDWDKLAGAIDNCSEEMDGYNGAAAKMAAVMQDNLEGQITILKSQLSELAISFGDMLMPTIRKVVEGVQGFVDKLNSMDERTRQIIITIGLVVAAIGPALVVIGKVVSAVGTVLTVVPQIVSTVKTIGTGLQTLWTTLAANPITLVIAAIAALVAAFIYFWNTSEEFRNFWIDLWEGIKEAASKAWEGITAGFKEAGEGIRQSWESIKEACSKAWEGIKTTFEPAAEFFGSVWDAAKQTVQEKLAAMKAAYEAHGGGVKGFFAAWWEGIKGYYTAGFDFLDNLTGGKLTAIANSFREKWNGIRDRNKETLEEIKANMSERFEAAKATVTGIWDNLKTTAANTWEGIKKAITNPIDAAQEHISNALDAIRGFFANLKLELPHIKLPHFSIQGEFSLNPPSVPHLAIEWYKQGGILAGPTIFGMNGSSLMAGGEAGREAVLPLDSFYRELSRMLDKKLGSGRMEEYLAIIAANSKKDLYINKKVLVAELKADMNDGLGEQYQQDRRGI